ncbi:MAG: MBL fold metallo-hydrolase [Actinomycetota bacterium]|nr:MBL fold metallo-hydrolase [Actinomycetota bacterium]
MTGLGLEILHTPGHTPGSISIMGNGWLFCGDLLFKQAAGRTDLPGGDSRELKNSLKKIRKMDKNLVIYPGHGQKTSLGWELDNNYYLSHDFLGKE